ncbi:hypothetical protein [Streptomyces sp. NPDC029526]|uniref:5'-methylthioadenosine/S-adenosylhomocysteine nucleosidase family protein n=1 Tax=Streptomyces sp. NPDC029526 TaxID=3155728 RepID=UPI0033EC2CD1
MTHRRVGVIVPLREEFGYVSEVLDLLGDFREQGRVYHTFIVPGTDVHGLLTVLHDMGQPSAALAAQDLIRVFHVPLVAVIGTGAALSPEVALGDVVVASEIDSYLHRAKAVEDTDRPAGTTLALAGTSWKPSAPLLDHVRNFPLRKASRDIVTDWSLAALAHCPLTRDLRPAQGPELRVAPVATGEVVVGSEEFKAVIRNKNRTLAAVEMEAGGAALSAYQSDTADVLVIRGISDHAAKDKTVTDRALDVHGRPNAWRRYAVTNASRLLVELLAAPDFPWRAVPPTGAAAAPAGPDHPGVVISGAAGPGSPSGTNGGTPIEHTVARRSVGRTTAAAVGGAATALAAEHLIHRRRDMEEAVEAAGRSRDPDAESRDTGANPTEGHDGHDGAHVDPHL